MRFRKEILKTIDDVKSIAIYLRKSRDEEHEVDVLDKHRQRLLTYAKQEGWKADQIKEYAEIGSSDTIEYREVFKPLLKHVENKMYDAVLVVHQDRLSRGETYQYGSIKKIFQKSNTLVITPNEVINWNEQSVLHDIKHSMVRYEFEMIRERFVEGKRTSFNKGNWWNGPAPYGYQYNPETKRLEINQEEADIFRYIVDSYIMGKGIMTICLDLRRQGKRTRPSKKFPNGAAWQENPMKRILENIAHLGHTAGGKTQGSLREKDKEFFKEFPKEEWEIQYDTHPPLLTQEESIISYILNLILIKKCRAQLMQISNCFLDLSNAASAGME